MKAVAAMLITRGRQQWAAQALACFQAQTYEPKWLLIIDDADDPSFPIWPVFPNVRYCLSSKSLTIPEKRNLAAGMIEAPYICHFDSDDHSEPTRISDQVRLLEESGRSVCGFHSLLFYEEQSGRAYKYLGDHLYSLGTSLMYLKSWWKDHPFRPGHPDVNVGEDNAFVREARERDQLIAVDGGQLMVARTHSANTSPRNPHAMEYRPVPLDALPLGFPR